ncbi:acyl-CoA dehydrogenase family protein [soil metagenome]
MATKWWPCSFESPQDEPDPAIRKLSEFFQAKGLAALKREDRGERWYDDWLAYQAQHRIYASVLSPAKYSSLGHRFDLRNLVRFLEAFAYFSPAHGYSIQCTFLGLFPILMSENEPLKREAIAILERGGLFALGVSEKAHGSDLLGNEFAIRPSDAGRFVANGSKYYIGNSNVAAMITILAKRDNGQVHGSRRSPMVLFALRNGKPSSTRNERKISTFGIRSGFVGEFDVKGYEFPQSDVVAEHRAAWDSVFGTVGLGKFFLGFGAIGICERAFGEAWEHVTARQLYGKPVIQMPHIRRYIARAYARLAAMKLYAYRALDYFHAAGETDRRYLLFAAVQKAKVSTDGVRVIEQLLECIGARGFESDTYFEMALRDIRLLPVLEGSSHINFALAGQFRQAYFDGSDAHAKSPATCNGEPCADEVSYLFTAQSAPPKSVKFADPSRAYQSLSHIASAKRFAEQFDAFQLFARSLDETSPATGEDTETAIALGKCVSTVAFAQLVAEHGQLLHAPDPIVSLIFHQLIEDFSIEALRLAGASGLSDPQRESLMGVIVRSSIDPADIEFAIEWIGARQ